MDYLEYCDYYKWFLTLAFKQHKADCYNSANYSWCSDVPVYNESYDHDVEDGYIIKYHNYTHSILLALHIFCIYKHHNIPKVSFHFCLHDSCYSFVRPSIFLTELITASRNNKRV